MSAAISAPHPEQSSGAFFEPKSPTRSQQMKSLYQRKDGTLTAVGKDGKRRVVSPYILASGSIGWTAREHDDEALVTAYPVVQQESRAGRFITQALVRSIAKGELDVRFDSHHWGEDVALAKKAVEFARGLCSSYISHHEHFDIRQIPEYQQFSYQPLRRKKRIEQMQGHTGEFDTTSRVASEYTT